MRYRLLGDLLSIKSALLYKRGYVDSVFSRNPSEQMNATKTNQSSHTSFMEYSFKFKIDKGSYSSFNLSDYFSDQTLQALTDDNDSSDVPSNLLMYQLSNSIVDRNYTTFEIFDSGGSTEMILNVDKDIQKIEFFSEFLNYEPGTNEKGEIEYPQVKEYSLDKPYLSAMVPVMIVEFGPEESYEPEDYYNKDEMPIKPDWDDESEHAYQFELEEYTNKKFLTISTTSTDSEPVLNLSLSAHKSQVDPHRNQEDYVVENKEFRSTLTNVGNTLKKSDNSDIVMDMRSNSILATSEIDTDLPLLKDRMRIHQVEVNGILYDDYLDYIVYNKGHKVHYKGDIYMSLIDGNLYENPSISPMWQLLSTVELPSLPEDHGQPHVVNVRVNDPELGTTDPIGPVKVEYGYELPVKIITDKATIKSIKVDGIEQPLPKGDIFTVMEVIADHDLLIEFNPIYHDINVTIDPSEEYGTIIGSGRYIQNTPATLVANANYGYEFLGWYKDESLLSAESTYKIDKVKKSENLVAKFDRKKYKITVSGNEGGTYLPKDGEPTVIEVHHGDSLDIELTPFSSYEVESISLDGEVIHKYYTDPIYGLEDIRSDHRVDIKFSRYQLHVIDPIHGRINYVIIDDQLWATSDLNNVMVDINNMEFIDITARDNVNFRVPSQRDWQKLYDHFNENSAGLYMKSPSITRFNPDGWKDTIYRGKGKYRLDFMPTGIYLGEDDKEVLIGKNLESWHWSTDMDKDSGSVVASTLLYDSPIAFFNDVKYEDSLMPVRLMSDTLRVYLLGKSYRYVNISIKIKVRVDDGDGYASDDTYETYLVSQDWLLDNFDYTELGVRFEEAESGKFGSLYNLDEVIEINNLLNGYGFHIPTNMDYIYLERYLGYGRDKFILTQDGSFEVDLDTYSNGYIGSNEGKRLKADMIYSGVDWNGYDTRSLGNSQLNVLPSGYAVVEDGELEFKSMGTMAKFWTSSVIEDEGTRMAYSRTISYSNDKILRGVDQGSRAYMSVRPVRTTITKI